MKTRRIFIKDTLATMAAISIAGKGSPSVLLAKAKEKLGVALVGLGYYSTDLLAPALQLTSHSYLSGIVTGTPEKAVRWQKQYNVPEKNIYNYSIYLNKQVYYNEYNKPVQNLKT